MRWRGDDRRGTAAAPWKYWRGSGSKLTAAGTQPSATARSRTRSSSAWWPRWTPSKAPMQTTEPRGARHGPSASRISRFMSGASIATAAAGPGSRPVLRPRANAADACPWPAAPRRRPARCRPRSRPGGSRATAGASADHAPTSWRAHSRNATIARLASAVRDRKRGQPGLGRCVPSRPSARHSRTAFKVPASARRQRDAGVRALDAAPGQESRDRGHQAPGWRSRSAPRRAPARACPGARRTPAPAPWPA